MYCWLSSTIRVYIEHTCAGYTFVVNRLFIGYKMHSINVQIYTLHVFGQPNHCYWLSIVEPMIFTCCGKVFVVWTALVELCFGTITRSQKGQRIQIMAISSLITQVNLRVLCCHSQWYWDGRFMILCLHQRRPIFCIKRYSKRYDMHKGTSKIWIKDYHCNKKITNSLIHAQKNL